MEQYVQSWTLMWSCICLCVLQFFPGLGVGFKTEPHFPEAAKLDITVSKYAREDLWDSKYVMLDATVLDRPTFRGPEIYDAKSGHLVWHGHQYDSQNLHVCDYQGQVASHLCFSYWSRLRRVPNKPDTFPSNLDIPPVDDWPAYRSAKHIILDSAYEMVENGSFEYMFQRNIINSHAFRMLKDGQSFISIVTKPAFVDLTPYGCPTRGSWVNDECIEEKDALTHESLFHWCYLESGLELWETFTFFVSDTQKVNKTSEKVGGCFEDRRPPWDFLHMNSVDKTPAGDYYVSARHLNQIIKIAGWRNPDTPPGNVIWRLGGKSSDFKMQNFNYQTPFARQHDVRFISASSSEEVISVFSNGWDGGMAKTQNSSEAQIIRLNTNTMTAYLDYRYPHPHGQITPARGGAEVLANGNIFVGWGEVPQCTEFSRNGTVLYHAEFSWPGEEHVFSYRCRKSNWIGTPNYPPKLVAYATTCNSLADRNIPIVAYMSWNGATEVKSWRIRTSDSLNGPWYDEGIFPRDNFETYVRLQVPWRDKLKTRTAFVATQALGEDDVELSEVVVAETFVPKDEYQDVCGSRGCGSLGFAYTRAKAKTCSSPDSERLSYIGFLILLSLIEIVGFLNEFGFLLMITPIHSKL